MCQWRTIDRIAKRKKEEKSSRMHLIPLLRVFVQDGQSFSSIFCPFRFSPGTVWNLTSMSFLSLFTSKWVSLLLDREAMAKALWQNVRYRMHLVCRDTNCFHFCRFFQLSSLGRGNLGRNPETRNLFWIRSELYRVLEHGSRGNSRHGLTT
jgi:hypothetical protein